MNNTNYVYHRDAHDITFKRTYDKRGCLQRWLKSNNMLEITKAISLWWLHQMETFSALLALCAGNSPVTGEFPTQGPVVQSFDIFFDLRLNKQLSKHSSGWWFEMPLCPLLRHCNDKECSPEKSPMTHWGWSKMVVILQISFWNAFSWLKFFFFI